jgi:hypothetical protein
MRRNVLDRLNKIHYTKSIQLLFNAEKLKNILDLLPYIPTVNRPFNENPRADSEASKAVDPEELD